MDENSFSQFICNNYKKIITISDECGKFLEEFDKVKEKLSNTYKTILDFDEKKNEQEEDSDISASSEDLEEDVDVYLEKRKSPIKKNEISLKEQNDLSKQ